MEPPSASVARDRMRGNASLSALSHFPPPDQPAGKKNAPRFLFERRITKIGVVAPRLARSADGSWFPRTGWEPSSDALRPVPGERAAIRDAERPRRGFPRRAWEPGAKPRARGADPPDLASC